MSPNSYSTTATPHTPTVASPAMIPVRTYFYLELTDLAAFIVHTMNNTDLLSARKCNRDHLCWSLRGDTDTNCLLLELYHYSVSKTVDIVEAFTMIGFLPLTVADRSTKESMYDVYIT
jgi:hypothetical protein